MRRRLHALVWAGLCCGVLFSSCLARRDKPFVRQTDDDGGTPDATALDDGAAPDATPDALDIAPHAVLGIDPPHGPFVGGTLVKIRGNGFESNARVWFGDVEVPRGDVTPVDPQRIQVKTPPGASGPVDLRVQNGDAASTSGTLVGGYTYDAFYADPVIGPTSGGTVITIVGDGTDWDEDTTVEIDRKPCATLTVLSPQKLECTAPPGEAGAKVLSVISGGERQDVLDGFSYDGIVDDGYVRALSGNLLSTQLTVLAYDNMEGRALPGVAVLRGEDVASGEVKYTDQNGIATFSGDLGEAQSITLALKCFQPMTFYDVPVDHVTAYLDPVLSPACAEFGPLPPGGGTPGVGSSVSGEVVWPPDGELKRRGWSNVPQPVTETEQQVAYVFRLSDRPDAAFQLPKGGAITRDAEGALGYKFYQSTSPGNFTLYTLAGVEDSSQTPHLFTAYAMGLLRGVAVKPGQTSDDVYIEVDVPLDHALKLTLEPPAVGSRGPDRIRASVAVQIENQGFAILPGGNSSRSLPGASDFSFVGVPPLAGTLAGTQYVLSARAVTGASESVPLSVIGSFSTTTTGATQNLGGFVPLPELTAPVKDQTWDLKSLTLNTARGGQRIDLTVVSVNAGGDLYSWTLVAPGGRAELKLPDLKALAPDAALPDGSMTIQTTLAYIADTVVDQQKVKFDYGKLRYRELSPRGWNAYATDIYNTEH